MIKLLISLSLLTITGYISAMKAPENTEANKITDPGLATVNYKRKHDNHPAVQFALETFAFAQISDAMHPIIAQELQNQNPNKWTARRQFSALIKQYFNDLSQNEINKLMNGFSECWKIKYNSMFSSSKR